MSEYKPTAADSLDSYEKLERENRSRAQVLQNHIVQPEMFLLAPALGFLAAIVSAFVNRRYVWTELESLFGDTGLLWVGGVMIGAGICILALYNRAEAAAARQIDLLATRSSSAAATLPSLSHVVDSTAASMGIGCEIQIRITARADLNASIAEIGGNVLLLVSPSFVFFARSQPETAKAVIAHELAHVRHKDTNNWIILQIVFSKLDGLLFVGIALVFAAVCYAFIETVDPVLLSSESASNDTIGRSLQELNLFIRVVALFAPSLASVWRLPERVVESRRISELAADAAAFEVVGESAMRDAISLTMPNRTPGVHPSREERLASLARLSLGRLSRL
jgi:hypothetical protein